MPTSRTPVLDRYEQVARERGVAAHELPREERLALAREVMPDVWPGWSTTSGSTRGHDVIEVVAHDPAWSERFVAWRGRLAAALGPVAQRIEHVGSTAVPGLPAKAIIDVQVSVTDPVRESAYVDAIEALGLQLRSRDAFHRYFRPPPDRPRDVHVHVCAAGSEWEREHLLFRDILRDDPRAREAYARAKRAAAKRWADDGFAYTEAKTAVVLAILGGDRVP